MDLSMLISTIITATAALTAIIGGFLVSRVITLASEKNSIKRRLDEVEIEINSKKEVLSWFEGILFEEDIDSFIEKYAEEILIEDQSVDTIFEDNDSLTLTRDELKPHIEKLRSIYERLKEAIEDTEKDYELPKEFDVFAKDTNIKVNDKRHWYEKAYRLIRKSIPKAPLSILQNFMQSTPNYIYSSQPNYFETQAYMDRIKDRDRLSDEIKILSGIKKELKKHLDGYGDIQGLWAGLSVLIFACFAGIIFPALLIIIPTQMAYILNITSELIAKHILIYLLLSELFVIFIYLGVSMYKLTKKG